MFWDGVAVVGKWVGIVFFTGVFLYILFLTVIGVTHLGKMFTWDLYHHVKYTNKGLCPKCHKPAQVRERLADQAYGPDRVRYLVCTCGAPSIPMGDRRSADWAGF
jgi:hypothetical protein